MTPENRLVQVRASALSQSFIRMAVLAIAFATVVVNGENPKAGGGTHGPEKTANATQQTDNPAGRTVVVVNQQTPQGQEDSHSKKTPTYLSRLLAPENIPNIALVLVGIAGIITAVYTLKVLSRQAVSMRRQTTLLRRSVLWSRRSARAAKESADAALLNAQAVINAERPWIVVTVERKAETDTFIFKGKNLGRTPAAIMSDWTEHRFADDPENLPVPPQYKDEGLVSPTKPLVVRDEPPFVVWPIDVAGTWKGTEIWGKVTRLGRNFTFMGESFMAIS
jgi:hypothetical protein